MGNVQTDRHRLQLRLPASEAVVYQVVLEGSREQVSRYVSSIVLVKVWIQVVYRPK